MRDFAFSLICAGVASGVIGMFFEGDNIGKYVKLVLSLCITAMIAASLFSCGKDAFCDISFGTEPFPTKDYEEFLIENSRNEMGRTLKRMIFEKTGITPEYVDIQFSVTEKEGNTLVDIASVTVCCTELCGNRELEEYVLAVTGKIPDIIQSEGK